MPPAPAAIIPILLALLVLVTRSTASVVLIKFDAAVVPVYPVNEQPERLPV